MHPRIHPSIHPSSIYHLFIHPSIHCCETDWGVFPVPPLWGHPALPTRRASNIRVTCPCLPCHIVDWSSNRHLQSANLVQLVDLEFGNQDLETIYPVSGNITLKGYSHVLAHGLSRQSCSAARWKNEVDIQNKIRDGSQSPNFFPNTGSIPCLSTEHTYLSIPQEACQALSMKLASFLRLTPINMQSLLDQRLLTYIP